MLAINILGNCVETLHGLRDACVQACVDQMSSITRRFNMPYFIVNYACHYAAIIIRYQYIIIG